MDEDRLSEEALRQEGVKPAVALKLSKSLAKLKNGK